MAKKEVFRVVTRATDGSLKIRDFHSAELIFRTHSQVGTDDSSTDDQRVGFEQTPTAPTANDCCSVGGNGAIKFELELSSSN